VKDAKAILVSNRHLTEDEDPDWSPDGTKIAFMSGNANQPIDVYAVNSDGSGVTQLTSGGLNYYPNWSPDGHQIAFVSARD
jgi:TolB protein